MEVSTWTHSRVTPESDVKSLHKARICIKLPHHCKDRGKKKICSSPKETSHYWLRIDGEILSPVTLSLQLSSSIGLRFEFLPQIQSGKPQDEACLLKVFQICHTPGYQGDKKAVPYWRKISTTKTLISQDYTQPCMGLPFKVTKLALKLEAWKLLLQLTWWRVLIWTVRRLFEFFFFLTIYPQYSEENRYKRGNI